MKVAVTCDGAPRSLISFRGAYYLHHQGHDEDSKVV
jgi:hypothetical protein